MALIDVVQFEGNDRDFVWKFPSDNLRFGSQLVVKPAQVAFFVYRGRICDCVEEGSITLHTGNIPLLTDLTSLPFGGDSPFPAEVWFVNLISKLDNKWGTQRPIQLEDPKYGLVVPVRAFGQFGFRIAEPRKFLEQIAGATNVFTADQVIDYFRGVILQSVSVNLGRAFVTQKISILEAFAHLDELATQCSEMIRSEFAHFGVELVNFFFHSINIPDDDASYKRLKVLKEKAAELSVLGRDVYQFDRSMDVLKTAAANEGSSAGLIQAGFGLAVGAGIGQQMAHMVTALPPQTTSDSGYYLVESDVATGPHKRSQLERMALDGRINATTLVWKQGMSCWQPASVVQQLEGLPFLSSEPPPHSRTTS